MKETTQQTYQVCVKFYAPAERLRMIKGHRQTELKNVIEDFIEYLKTYLGFFKYLTRF
jgi:hypothetical protein